MHLTFRQLRLFQALADKGSVSAAANAMHVTQPTASMQLKEMTTAIGLPLYEGIGNKIFLTETGLSLASTAREMCQTWESFEQLASQLGHRLAVVEPTLNLDTQPQRLGIRSLAIVQAARIKLGAGRFAALKHQ
jgi:DNA-binding transcriptional LysR family regulator